MRARIAALAMCLCLLGAQTGFAQSPDCTALPDHLQRITTVYEDHAALSLQGDEFAKAQDIARQKAVAGDVSSTVTMVGLRLLLRPSRAGFSVDIIRQVCTFGQRNGLALHNIACAYLTALVPLGEVQEKRVAAEAALLRARAVMDQSDKMIRLSPDQAKLWIEALAVCLPPKA